MDAEQVEDRDTLPLGSGQVGVGPFDAFDQAVQA
jgi:hypothetical protein